MDPFDSEQLIQRAASGHGPDAALRQRLREQSARAFMKAKTVRVWHHRFAAGGVVTLVAMAAFVAGRCTCETRLQADRVAVPRDLVTWLEAGRFFAQLGMPEREARAYQQASRLAAVPDQSPRLAAAGTPLARLLARCDTAISEAKKYGDRNGIIAQAAGGFDYGR
jgi:hypothetical protein